MKYLSLVTLMTAASCSMAIAILLLTNYTYNAGVAPMAALLSISGIVLFIMFYKEWNRLFLK